MDKQNKLPSGGESTEKLEKEEKQESDSPSSSSGEDDNDSSSGSEEQMDEKDKLIAQLQEKVADLQKQVDLMATDHLNQPDTAQHKPESNLDQTAQDFHIKNVEQKNELLSEQTKEMKVSIAKLTIELSKATNQTTQNEIKTKSLRDENIKLFDQLEAKTE